MPPKKVKEVGPPPGLDASLNSELSAAGCMNYVKLAEDFCDMDVICVPTGFPQLDYILHDKLRGCPRGRDVEIYSKEPELGKTTISLAFLKAFQKARLRTCYDDVERTMTLQYLKDLGMQIRPEENMEQYAIRLMRHEDSVIPAEVWLDTLIKLCGIMDLVVVDSVAALEKKANLEKKPGEPNQVGGLSLLLSEFYRKNVAKKATILWINQMRTKIGQYSPNGSVPLDTTGGKAIKFYSSIRLELSYVDKIRETKDGDPIGMKIKVFTSKNKVAPQFRQAIMSYIFGTGFSQHFDYMDAGLKNEIITKKGSWLSFGNWKAQGPLNFHNLMREDAELFKEIRIMVDGEDSVVAENVSQGTKPEDFEE
jgi:recombination protein RecA